MAETAETVGAGETFIMESPNFLEDAVVLRNSPLHGMGVFARTDVKEGDVLFVDRGGDALFADRVLRIGGAPRVGVSTAWPITVHLVQMRPDNWPAWVARLARNRQFASSVLKDNRELPLAREIMRRFPNVNVLDVFALVVTNFFDNGIITSLGRRSSRVNHSNESANVRNMILSVPNSNDPQLAWVATCDISAGSELLFDYGAEYADRMRAELPTRNWACNQPVVGPSSSSPREDEAIRHMPPATFRISFADLLVGLPEELFSIIMRFALEMDVPRLYWRPIKGNGRLDNWLIYMRPCLFNREHHGAFGIMIQGRLECRGDFVARDLPLPGPSCKKRPISALTRRWPCNQVPTMSHLGQHVVDPSPSSPVAAMDEGAVAEDAHETAGMDGPTNVQNGSASGPGSPRASTAAPSVGPSSASPLAQEVIEHMAEGAPPTVAVANDAKSPRVDDSIPDVFARLPVELMVHIVEHLPPRDIARLHCVARALRDSLLDERSIKAVMAAYRQLHDSQDSQGARTRALLRNLVTRPWNTPTLYLTGNGIGDGGLSAFAGAVASGALPQLQVRPRLRP